MSGENRERHRIWTAINAGDLPAPFVAIAFVVRLGIARLGLATGYLEAGFRQRLFEEASYTLHI